MKKSLLFVLFICFSIFNIFAEGYKIEKIEYDLSGITRETSLKAKFPVDTYTIFQTKEELENYIQDLQKQLSNNRIFDSASVEITSIEPGSEYNNVSILIETDDTWNIIALPYPSYDSNSGFKLKLKVKDYNFMGSMETFDITGNYKFDPEKKTNDFDISFDIPFPSFKILSFDSSFSMDFEVAYTYGDRYPSFDFGQSLGFGKSINDYFGINFGVSNTFYIAPDYKDFGSMGDL